MDERVKSWIEKYKSYSGKSQINSEESRKYHAVSFDNVYSQLCSLFPGSAPLVESLDPESGRVAFQDGAHGRKVIPLTQLGYRLVTLDNESIWARGKTLFQILSS